MRAVCGVTRYVNGCVLLQGLPLPQVMLRADRASLVWGRTAPVDPPLQPCSWHLLLVKHDAHWAARANLPVSLPAGSPAPAHHQHASRDTRDTSVAGRDEVLPCCTLMHI